MESRVFANDLSGRSQGRCPPRCLVRALRTGARDYVALPHLPHAHGTEEDVQIAHKYYSDVDFQAALDNPTPGVFFRDAWIKWNTRYNRVPVPPLPKRHIPGVDPNSIPDLFPAKSYRPGA